MLVLLRSNGCTVPAKICPVVVLQFIYVLYKLRDFSHLLLSIYLKTRWLILRKAI